MVNDFMKNTNKVSLDGEVVSFSSTLPIVEKEEVAETPTTKPKKEEKAKVEETVVEEKADDEVEESAETSEETKDEE